MTNQWPDCSDVRTFDLQAEVRVLDVDGQVRCFYTDHLNIRAAEIDNYVDFHWDTVVLVTCWVHEDRLAPLYVFGEHTYPTDGISKADCQYLLGRLRLALIGAGENDEEDEILASIYTAMRDYFPDAWSNYCCSYNLRKDHSGHDYLAAVLGKGETEIRVD